MVMLLNFLPSFLVALLSYPAFCPGKIVNVDSGVFLNGHNKIRQEVAAGKLSNQPPGTIPDMTWDAELAVKAQNFANTCPHGHNPDRNFKGGTVGENFAMGSDRGSPEADIEMGIGMWKDEYKSYRFSSQYSPSAGHYTQIVWANSKSLGCGLADCGGMFYLICNYFPAGNVFGQYPYSAASKRNSDPESGDEKPAAEGTPEAGKDKGPLPNTEIVDDLTSKLGVGDALKGKLGLEEVLKGKLGLEELTGKLGVGDALKGKLGATDLLG